MGAELAKVQKDLLFKSEYTGINTGSGAVYPPVINILQSDKQFKAFGNADMSTKSYGKLFIRNEANRPEDLVDELVGTAIKIEVGHEVRDEQKVIGSGDRLLSPDEKEDLESKGLKPINMVKVLLAIGDAKATSEAMVNYDKKMENNTASSSDFPFALLSIKGSSWGSWIEAQSQMEDLCQREYGVASKDSIASLFKFSIKSKEENSTKYGKYYSTEVAVELNDPDEASAFAPMVVGMKDFGMFYEVAQKIENRENVVDTFKGM